MSEEKKTVELKEEELEKVSGGRSRPYYTINVGIYHIASDVYFQVTSQQRVIAGGGVQGIVLRLAEDGKLHKDNATQKYTSSILIKSPTVNNLDVAY